MRVPAAWATAGVLAGALAGCGSGSSATSTQTRPAVPALASAAPSSCRQAVLDTLTTGVLERVYREGVSSERTTIARRAAASPALRGAVESGQPAAGLAAARRLISEGHIADLDITAGGRALVSVGGPALAPLSGTITGPAGRALARYSASVWSDAGFLAEGEGITGGQVAIRADNRSLGGSPALGHRALGDAGTITIGGVASEYDSFPAESLQSVPVRIYLLRSAGENRVLCGSSVQDTVVNTLHHVARSIYNAELSTHAFAQVQRVENDSALVQAVAERNPAATRGAVKSLLNEHIVRLRVYSRHELLADVGGVFVLAPVQGVLRRNGDTIGRFLLSIQDDEGYKRLTDRLAGVKVLMYMDGQLVKNSLGPAPGDVPPDGLYEYRGRSYRVFTLHLNAFPSGPLLVRGFVPVPYS
jgi:hypothetical protein